MPDASLPFSAACQSQLADKIHQSKPLRLPASGRDVVLSTWNGYDCYSVTAAKSFGQR
jgi:hypothetical protein